MKSIYIPKGMPEDQWDDYRKQESERKARYYYAHRDEIKQKREGYMEKYYLEHKEKWVRTEEKEERRNRQRREKYANDPVYREKIKEKVRDYNMRSPHVKKAHRLRQYNLTVEKFEELFNSQSRKCAICGYSDMGVPNFFPMVDHCHDNGGVRGILCSNCNMGLGKFKNDPELLKKASIYLEEFNEKVVNLVQSE